MKYETLYNKWKDKIDAENKAYVGKEGTTEEDFKDWIESRIEEMYE